MIRGPACLSRLRCDQLLNGELDDAEAQLAHAAGCARCGALLDAHRHERAVFAVPLRRPRRRWPVAAVVVAAAAGLLLIPRLDDTTRSKGGPVLGFYVKRGDAITRGGDRVAPGDVLDFTVATPAAAFVAVISIDGAGQVSTYYPAGPIAAPVAPGAQLLPLAVRLDGVLGIERLHGVFCDHPAPVAALQTAIALDTVPAGCTVDTLTVEKR